MFSTVLINFIYTSFAPQKLTVVGKFLPHAHPCIFSQKRIHAARSDCGHYLCDQDGNLIDVWGQSGVGYFKGELCEFKLIR